MLEKAIRSPGVYPCSLGYILNELYSIILYMGLYTLLLKIRGKKFPYFHSSLSPRYISPKRNYIEKNNNNKTLKTK